MGNMFKCESEFIPDSLLVSSELPFIIRGVKIGKGEGILKRGTLIGKGSDGNFYPIGKVISGVDIIPDGILTDDIDASEEDILTTKYISGVFNKSEVIVADGGDINDYADELRKISILFKSVEK